MNVLVVIPARGGSKGIPRKNLRKLGDLPLIAYSIKTALGSVHDCDVYVSSDDDEILTISEQLGANRHDRSKSLAEDATTLDPVIFEAYQYAKEQKGEDYDVIVTLQPTSPLLEIKTLNRAISEFKSKSSIDTIISAVNDTHLTWLNQGGKFVPNYEKRLNRQQLTPVYKETGGFLMTRNTVISENNRIGENVHLFELNGKESIDIDTFEDWNLCEYYLTRKKVLFVVTGNQIVGLGHAYNTLILANEILNHDVSFLVDKDSQLAFDKIAANNYNVSIQTSSDILDDIMEINPDVIVNDCLDTEEDYILSLKKLGFKVINFEDIGPGANKADIVINAIYPEKEKSLNHYYGPDYFCARDEYLILPEKVVSNDVKTVLLTFGGVDPNNLTLKTLESIYDFCITSNIKIKVILGLGYQELDSLKKFENIEVKRNVSNMALEMLNADVCFTSAGRTTYELALVGTPSIVMAQNDREMTHFFADEVNGFVSLGMGVDTSNEQILEELKVLVEDSSKRNFMFKKMKNNKIKEGKRKVIQLLKNCIEYEN